ncbi:MAG TPA: lipoprotein [Burkholderiaceae bacterium]|nr:lipoprotein [Burkholderiaceae bacterium]
MAGPAIVMVACIITIILAASNFSDQDIRDGGVKRGLVVSKQPAPDAPATVEQAPGK